MGACLQTHGLPDVPVPLPLSLEGFQEFSRSNTLKSLRILRDCCDVEKGKKGMSPLEGPYMIRATPDSGYQETVVMEPAAEALKALIDWTNHEIKSRNAEVEPDADHHVQARQLMCRVYCALLMSRKLIVARGPRFYGQMNPKLLHDAIQMPFERKQLAILCGLFADLNRSKTGLLTVIEFSEFFKQDYPQVVSALFFRFIFELTIRQSPLGACCEEFCIIINHLALMNESELLRLVFNCLANSTDAQKEKYCDMAGLKERFPSLHIGDTAKNLENRTFMKEVHDLMINRLETWDGPFYEKQGHILRLEDFIEMKRKSKHLLHSVLFAQTCVRKRLFGEFFWNDREVTLRAKEGLRLQDDLGGRPIMYFLEARTGLRHRPLPYSVRPLSLSEVERKVPPEALSRRQGLATTQRSTPTGTDRPAITSRRASSGNRPTSRGAKSEYDVQPRKDLGPAMSKSVRIQVRSSVASTAKRFSFSSIENNDSP